MWHVECEADRSTFASLVQVLQATGNQSFLRSIKAAGVESAWQLENCPRSVESWGTWRWTACSRLGVPVDPRGVTFRSCTHMPGARYNALDWSPHRPTSESRWTWQRRTPSFWPTGSRRLPRHPERAVGPRGRRWPSTVVWSRCQSLSTLCSLWAPCSRPQSIVRRLNTLRWRSASTSSPAFNGPSSWTWRGPRQSVRSSGGWTIVAEVGPLLRQREAGLFGVPRLRLRRARGAAHSSRQGTVRRSAYGSVVPPTRNRDCQCGGQ